MKLDRQLYIALIVWIAVLLLLAWGKANCAPTAPLSTVSGVVINPDGTVCAMCSITFTPNGQGTQIVNGFPVFPKIVSTQTDANGLLTPIQLDQGTAMSVTITDPNGNTSAQTNVPVPCTNGVSFAQLMAMNQLQTGAQSVNGLDVGTHTINATQNAYAVLPTDLFIDCDASLGPLTITLPASAGDGRWLEIKKVDTTTNACIIQPNLIDTIDTISPYNLTLPQALVDIKDSNVGLWSIASAYRQQYVGQDFAGNNLTSVGNISGQTGSGSGITAENWNGVIDPRAYGCHNDYLQDPGVNVTSGSIVLNSTGANLWQAHDCQAGMGSGCTGALNKVIRIEDTTRHYHVYTGTIASFTNSAQITLSTAPNIITGDTFEAEWASPDGTCLTNLRASAGPLTQTVGLNATFTIPIAQTTTFNLGPFTGRIEGSGCAGSPFIWFGPPDIPQVVAQPFGSTIDGLCLVGATSSPPSASLELTKPTTNLVNVNHISNLTINPASSLPGTDVPQDWGSGIVTPLLNSSAAFSAAIQLTTISVTAGIGLVGPNEALYIVDTYPGSYQGSGNEVVEVSPAYVRNSSNILPLRGGPFLPHTTSGYVVVPLVPSVYGINDGSFTTNVQAQNVFSNVWIGATDVCATTGQQAGRGTEFDGVHCDTSVIGFLTHGQGTVAITNTNLSGVAVHYVPTGAGRLTIDNSNASNQNTSGSNGFGPNFAYAAATTPNSQREILLEPDPDSGADTTVVEGKQMTVDMSSNVDSAGDQIEEIGGEAHVDIRGANLVDDPGGATPDLIPANILQVLNPTAATYFRMGYVSGNSTRVVTANEIGIGGFTSMICRDYVFERYAQQPNLIPELTNIPWCNQTPYQNNYIERVDTLGTRNHYGAMTVKVIPTSTAAQSANGNIETPPGVNCTATSSSQTATFYKALGSVTDADGATYWQQPPSGSLKVVCDNSNLPSGTNPVVLTIVPPIGADTINLFAVRVNCGSSCGSQTDPGGEMLINSQPINHSPQNIYQPNTMRDLGQASLGTALPAAGSSGNLSVDGGLTVGLNLKVGGSFVANGGASFPTLGFGQYYSGTGANQIPNCVSSPTARQWACVTDAATCTSGTTYVPGGGSTLCLLECSNAGTAWKESGVNCF